MQLNATGRRPRVTVRRVLGSLLLTTLALSSGCEESGPEPAPVAANSSAPSTTNVTKAPTPSEQPPIRSPDRVSRKQTLRLAIISAKPARALAAYSPLARRLAAASGRVTGVVDATSSAEVAIGRLCAGESDLLLDTVVVSVRTMIACGAQPLLVAAKRNTLRYASVIFVRQESALVSLADLAGHTIAFEDGMSTSGYLLPKFLLEDTGLELVATGQAQKEDAVRYSFVRDELNIVGRVVHGLADAGALSTNDMEDYREAAVRVIGKSPEVPRQLLMGSAALSKELVETLRDQALGLHKGESGKRALAPARIGRFDRVTDADHQVLKWLRGREQARPL